jgi:hypothetical protein
MIDSPVSSLHWGGTVPVKLLLYMILHMAVAKSMEGLLMLLRTATHEVPVNVTSLIHKLHAML